MKFLYAGTLQRCLGNLASEKNPDASVGILGKMSREMSFVAAKYDS